MCIKEMFTPKWMILTLDQTPTQSPVHTHTHTKQSDLSRSYRRNFEIHPQIIQSKLISDTAIFIENIVERSNGPVLGELSVYTGHVH